MNRLEQVVSLHTVLNVRVQQQAVRLRRECSQWRAGSVKRPRLGHLHLLKESQTEVLEDDAVARGEEGEDVGDEVLLVLTEHLPVPVIHAEINLSAVQKDASACLYIRHTASSLMGKGKIGPRYPAAWVHRCRGSTSQRRSHRRMSRRSRAGRCPGRAHVIQVVVVQDSRLSESSRERLSGEGLGVDGSGGKSTDMDASTGAISSQVSSSWFRKHA